MARASKAAAAKKSGAAKKAAGTKKKAKATTEPKKTKAKAAPKGAATRATKATKKAAESPKSVAKATKSTAAKASAAKAAPEKAAAPRKSKKVRSPFDTRFLEQMRKSLHSERDTYERQARNLRAEAESLVADLDPGDVQFDEESGEGDTIAVERNRDLALAAKAIEMIEEIDHALGKFDLGTYGICEVSGEPIPKERLEAIPWAREKVEYKVGGFGRR
jgi:RNA polymerase-binding transcription factor DksA